MAAVVLAVMDDNEDVTDLSYTTRVLMWDEERPPCLGIPGLQARLLLLVTWGTLGARTVHARGVWCLLGGRFCCGDGLQLCTCCARPLSGCNPAGQPCTRLQAATLLQGIFKRTPASAARIEAHVACKWAAPMLWRLQAMRLATSTQLQGPQPHLGGTAGPSPCTRAQVEVHGTEEALMDALVEAVRALDPDIIVGWEVQQGSLGYLIDRAAQAERPLCQQLSRTPSVSICWRAERSGAACWALACAVAV